MFLTPIFPPTKAYQRSYSQLSRETRLGGGGTCLITFHLGVEVGQGAVTFAFVMFLPEKTDEVIAQRAALFTWDDKSMNHLFQHRSAVAPGGMILPRSTHTVSHTHPHVKSRASVLLCW